jgi:thiol-disulfide isomerase/thioredoxin
MLKKLALACASIVVLLAAVALVLYARNTAPVVPAIALESISANPAKPYVVKLHAQWCPLCMVTKDVWAQIEAAYADRVHLVVLDFTNEARTAASRAEATRLGLNALFDEYEGVTGAVLVVDGRTKSVTADIGGSRDFVEYRNAIEASLGHATK